MEKQTETPMLLCDLPECGQPGTVRGDSKGRTWFCTEAHRTVRANISASQFTCSVCRARNPRPNKGRPPLYCGRDCQRQREKDVNAAAKELARGALAGDLEAMLVRAEILLTVWAPNHPQRLTMDQLIDRYWSGNTPPAPKEKPSADAVRALGDRISELRKLATRERKERKQNEDRKVAREFAKRKEEILAAQRRDNERQWKQQVMSEGVILE